MRRLLTLLVALLLPATPLASVSDPEAGPVPAVTRDVTLDVRAVGLRRSYRLYVPPRERSRRLPLLVAIHGAFSSPEMLARRSGFSELADREGFAVAYARGHGLLGKLRHWNSGHCCGFARSIGIDDVGYLKAVIEDAKRRVPIDASRVYMVGHSNGGMLTYRFAAEETPLLAAAAVSAATIGGRPAAGQSEWLPPRPADTIPILHVHGRADAIVLYDGGEDRRSRGRTWISARDSVRFWAEHNGCERAAAERRLGILSLSVWGGCRDGAEVALYTVEDWGHFWAGSRRAARTGTAPDGFDAASAIWRFLSGHRRESRTARLGAGGSSGGSVRCCVPSPRHLSPSGRQRLIRSAAPRDGAGHGSMGLTIRQRARPLRESRGTGQSSLRGRRLVAAGVESFRWKKW